MSTLVPAKLQLVPDVCSLIQAFPDAASYAPHVDATDAHSPCGICLVDLNDRPVEWSNWTMSTACLAYGSKKYHSTCANFWCNKVNPVLPALSPLAAGLL